MTAYTGTDPVLGKSVTDLQSGITVSDDAITGQLVLTNGYTGYSSNVSEQSGAYLVLQANSTNENAVITAEIVDATDASVKMLDNGILIARCGLMFIDQKLKITARADGCSPVVKVFDLHGLTAVDIGDITWGHEDPTYDVDPEPIVEPGIPPYS